MTESNSYKSIAKETAGVIVEVSHCPYKLYLYYYRRAVFKI